jgi:hypothetical protein
LQERENKNKKNKGQMAFINDNIVVKKKHGHIEIKMFLFFKNIKKLGKTERTVNLR